ncbi:gliding motility-associated ABC transporter permease subunit GldF [Pleomorphovibrio marinus]|uniref:gliding motility-associated ABC transporter permease subunit GldF n=1 Tax=Pleomorphovibrio marinus TaxID=2164132 RepID=UPI000E0BB681|nr:gliding motility-associated ABC transporter permease subunit GldF [Pleomorphovibrio marinus]
MFSLYVKELNGFFSNLTGYIILVVFLVALGLIVWVFPGTSVLEYGYAELDTLFSHTPLVFVFLVPAITMRMIAEEKKTGTWELLMTSPLTAFQIVGSKYMAALTLILFALLPTLVYYYSVVQLGDPTGNIDSAGFFGSYIGLVMVGAAFAAIGLFTSSFTDNQIVAFVLGVFFGFFLYTGLSALAGLQTGTLAMWMEELSISYHYDSMGRGVVESKNVYYFIALISTVLALTWGVISKK